MATSGSVDFSYNTSQIVNSALRLTGVLGTGETPTADDNSAATEALNVMLKALQGEGLNLFTRKRMSILLEKNKRKYTVGTDHITYSYTRTQVKTAAIAAATSIDVDSTSGMAASDYIGIELDDGTIHWTTVSSVTDSDTVVIASGLASAAAVDNYVYFYRTKADRPLRLIQAWVRDVNTNDTPISLISQQEYYDIGNKTSDGLVSQIFYDPQLTGVFYVWPETDDVTNTVELIVQKPFDDMDSSTNTLDFPVEWTEAIKYGLAARIGAEWQIPLPRLQYLTMQAELMKQNAKSFDVENNSIYFSPSG